MFSVCVSILVWLQSLNLFRVVLPSGCSHGFLLLFPTCQKYYISTMKFRFFLLYCCDNSVGFKQWMISHLYKRMLCCKLVEINVSAGEPAGLPWGSRTVSHWQYRKTHSLHQWLMFTLNVPFCVMSWPSTKAVWIAYLYLWLRSLVYEGYEKSILTIWKVRSSSQSLQLKFRFILSGKIKWHLCSISNYFPARF